MPRHCGHASHSGYSRGHRNKLSDHARRHRDDVDDIFSKLILFGSVSWTDLRNDRCSDCSVMDYFNHLFGSHRARAPVQTANANGTNHTKFSRSQPPSFESQCRVHAEKPSENHSECPPQRQVDIESPIMIQSPRVAPHHRGLQPSKSCLNRTGRRDRSRPRRVQISNEAICLETGEEYRPNSRSHKQWKHDTQQQRARRRGNNNHYSVKGDWEPQYRHIAMMSVSKAPARAWTDWELDKQLSLARRVATKNMCNTTVITSKRDRHLHPCLITSRGDVDW
ncbi:hypothetical protein QBC38DRAFT_491730 [Podospora fimiseda]|uniref:Uncharacterized protein n=1 Tax=Podospora fimiseda TaxID=252190 RepID=A0AAN6YLS2_9PEZI|nr:hypothetical protein QBC38DRAFT_491730 [Podospora fimiseda]